MQEGNCFSVLKLKGCCEFVQIHRTQLGNSWNINSCVYVKKLLWICANTQELGSSWNTNLCVCVCKRNRPQRKCIKLTHIQLNKLLQKSLETSSFEKHFQLQYHSDNYCTHIHSNSLAKIPLHLAKNWYMIPEQSTERPIKVFLGVYYWWRLKCSLKSFPTNQGTADQTQI